MRVNKTSSKEVAAGLGRSRFSGDSVVIPALEAVTKDRDADSALAARRAIERITRH
jgi:hypothetical protein